MTTNQQLMVIGGGIVAAGLAVAFAPEVIAAGAVANEAGTVIAAGGLSSQGMGAAAALGGAATMVSGAVGELVDQFGPAVSQMGFWGGLFGGGGGGGSDGGSGKSSGKPKGLQPEERGDQFDWNQTDVVVENADGTADVVVVEIPEGDES